MNRIVLALLALGLPACLACSPEIVRISESDILPPRELLRACGQNPDVRFVASSQEEQRWFEAWKSVYQELLGFSDPAMSERIVPTALFYDGDTLRVSWYYINGWIYRSFTLLMPLSAKDLNDDDALKAAFRTSLDQPAYRPLVPQDMSLFLPSATKFLSSVCGGTFENPDCPRIECNEEGFFYANEGTDEQGNPLSARMDLFTFKVVCGDEAE